MKKMTISFKFKGEEYVFSATLPSPIDTEQKTQLMLDFIRHCHKLVGAKREREITRRKLTWDGWGFWCDYII